MPGHVGVRDEAAQAPPADRRACQQHEVRAACALADPAQVLLDRLAMAGEARALGPRPLRDAVERDPRRDPGVRRPPAAPSRSPGRDHDPVGIGSGRVEQLDLDPDDRVQPDGLGRPDEAHRAVQAGVVGDGQPGQPQLDGPLDQVVRRRGAVEEREVGVAMQFRVRGRGHETLRVAGLEGACQYRTSVLSRYARSAPGPTAGWTTGPRGAFLSRCDRTPPAGSPRSGSRSSWPSSRPRSWAWPVTPRARTPPRPSARAITGIKPLTKEVYGYLPYWRLDSGTADRLVYDYVSTIAFFGLGILADGNIDTSWVGYKEYVGDDAAAVTNAAHDKGVRVVPTFQLFDGGALHKMTAFLGSDAAQARFIAQALDLMAERKADGANLDFEPMPASMTPAYLAFVARLRTAMQARFPGSTLVNSTSAGAGAALVAGPRAPRRQADGDDLRVPDGDGDRSRAPRPRWPAAERNVNIHITRILKSAPARLDPARRALLRVRLAGRHSAVPNATVRADKTTYGPAKSITYAAARDYLAAHPTIVRHHDTVEGSAFYFYRDSAKKTWREVYFDDERSLAAKYDYALVPGPRRRSGSGPSTTTRATTSSGTSCVRSSTRPSARSTIRGSISHLHRTRGRRLADGPRPRPQHRDRAVARLAGGGRSRDPKGPHRRVGQVGTRRRSTRHARWPMAASVRSGPRAGSAPAPTRCGSTSRRPRGAGGRPVVAFRQPY